jgi:hypothetical protein
MLTIDSAGAAFQGGNTIDIESLQNRLLKVCYVPATSASSSKAKLLLFFFFAATINSTNEANNAGSTCH